MPFVYIFIALFGSVGGGCLFHWVSPKAGIITWIVAAVVLFVIWIIRSESGLASLIAGIFEAIGDIIGALIP